MSFVPVPSAASQYLRVSGGRLARSWDPYTQQRFTALPGRPASITVAGGIVYPTQSRLGVTAAASCEAGAGLLFTFAADGGDFQAEVPGGLSAGEYRLCFCDALQDDTLDTGDPAAVTWRVDLHSTSDAVLAVDHPDRCDAKCLRGCVGPECHCAAFLSRHALGEELGAVLCVEQAACRSLCAATEDCAAYTMDVDAPLCWFGATTASSLSGDRNVWYPEPGEACATASDFFPGTNIGTLAVTDRVDIGADYVVTPGQPAILEVTGRSFYGASWDSALLIPGYGVCGQPEPSEWSSGVLLPSWASSSSALLFENLVLEAGTYKLCFCDVDVIGGACSSAHDYTVEVGRVHASGLSCLFGTSGVTTACTDMPSGGYRCYKDDIPALA